jgi:uncharacterized membrane protein YcaP (DUF421 family)
VILRLHGNVGAVRDVALAVFERNGHISVVHENGREFTVRAFYARRLNSE